MRAPYVSRVFGRTYQNLRRFFGIFVDLEETWVKKNSYRRSSIIVSRSTFADHRQSKLPRQKCRRCY